MKTNWQKVGIELETWKIPVDLEIRFERERDAGAFRFECRKFGVSEEAIDFRINELENSW